MNKRIAKKKHKPNIKYFYRPLKCWNTNAPDWKRRNLIDRLHRKQTIYWGFTNSIIKLSKKCKRIEIDIFWCNQHWNRTPSAGAGLFALDPSLAPYSGGLFGLHMSPMAPFY